MRRTLCIVVAGTTVFALMTPGEAAPPWTKKGTCSECHAAALPGVLEVTSHYTLANPDDHGRRKVFWAKPGQTAHLLATVSGLADNDRYGVMLKGLGSAGVHGSGPLQYGADCGWSRWSGNFFTDPPRNNDASYSYVAPNGPGLFQYDLYINPACPPDYYELTFAVAGAPKEGTDFFYDEEHFYLLVSATAPPLRKGADFDTDGDVDLADFLSLQACFNGPNRPAAQTGCALADLDEDNDVDLSDFLSFQACFNGPNRPPTSECKN